MKKLTIWLLSSLVGVLTFISVASAASACNWVLYEPELPSKLRR
ncbi:MAG: cyclic lactone autoinducer peptide [Dethiobacteria bacterium]|jgi:cyclic lactone autoinducer peptide